MKHTIWLFDGSYEIVNDTDFENGIAEVERAMLNKTPIYLGTSTVSGSAISKIEPFKKSGDVNQSSRLESSVMEVFQIESQPSSFWRDLILLNRQRKEQGKPWPFNMVVERGRRESGFTSAQEVVDFLDAEWDSFKEFNYRQDLGTVLSHPDNKKGDFCGKCENGWYVRKSGAGPCSCNAKVLSLFQELH